MASEELVMHLIHVGNYWIAMEHISGFYDAPDGILTIILDEGENSIDIQQSNRDYESLRRWIVKREYDWKAELNV